MANAARDNNRTSTMICLLNTDGNTPTNIRVNPSNNALKISDGTTGADNGQLTDRDSNRRPVAWGVSSVDLTTPVAIYADFNGNLLTQST